ncbi:MULTISPECIES: hypothetical protein [Planococcus]|uniref:hypothetical protein n=1 Tax=Planococcus TaxID=1372 RepID=UPI001B8BD973|nr:hypothetical protein [Planococcus sp. MSAK28401]
MKKEKKYNLKYHTRAFSVAFAIIFLSYIDKYIYDFRTLTGAILAGILAYILMTLFEKLPFLEKEISKRTENFLTVLALFLIFFSFYFFQL